MSGYKSLQEHHSMFFDDCRNQYYFSALQKVIDKDSVILDLGAGLGILGLMALSLGAKKVYLVEPASIIETTRMVIKANKLSDRVVCIEGTIEEVELPERVDIITSVFTGNFLLQEDLLPSLFYARDKFLRPEGKLIPDRAKMITVPISFPKYYVKHIDCWSKSVHNVDFNLVRKFAANNIYSVSPQKEQIDLLSEPAEIIELDFMTSTEASCRKKIEIVISKDKELHGFLGWFDAKLGDEWLSTSPIIDQQMHWNQLFLPLEEPLNVVKGETVKFELNRPQFSEWSWVVEAEDKRQKHSTFLSEPVIFSKVMKEQNHYKPRLSEKGKMTKEILQLWNGDISLTEIISKIQIDFPGYFSTNIQLEQFVKNLVAEYT